MQMCLKKCFQTSLEMLNKIDKLASLKMAILDHFIAWKEKKKRKYLYYTYITNLIRFGFSVVHLIHQ